MKNQQKRSRKKVFILLSVLCFIFVSLTAFALTYGDVNSDGSINILDALLTAQYSAGLNPANFTQAAAEVSGDGLVNINDALLIARYSAGVIDRFPVTVTSTPTITRSPTPTPSAYCQSCGAVFSAHVTDASGNPVVGAAIYINLETTPTTYTNALGNFYLELPGFEGNACPRPTGQGITVKRAGYQDYYMSRSPDSCGMGATVNMVLTPLTTPHPTITPTPTIVPTCEACYRYVSGVVTDSVSGLPIGGAQIYENNVLVLSTYPNGKFSYSRADIRAVGSIACPVGDVMLTVKATGHADYNKALLTGTCTASTVNVSLVPVIP